MMSQEGLLVFGEVRSREFRRGRGVEEGRE